MWKGTHDVEAVQYQIDHMLPGSDIPAIYKITHEDNKIILDVRCSMFNLRNHTPYLYVRKVLDVERGDDGELENIRYFFEIEDNMDEKEIESGSVDICLSDMALTVYTTISAPLSNLEDVYLVRENGDKILLKKKGEFVEDKVITSTTDYFDEEYYRIENKEMYDFELYKDYTDYQTIVFRDRIDTAQVKEVHIDGQTFELK